MIVSLKYNQFAFLSFLNTEMVQVDEIIYSFS